MYRALLPLLLLAGPLCAQLPPTDRHEIPDPTPLLAEVVARNLELPWDLVWGPDDKIWFTERTGALKRFDPRSGDVQLLDTVPGVFNSSDNSGLHALLLHPSFPDSNWIYVTYTYQLTAMRLSRFRFGEEGLYDEQVLIDMPGQDSHNGARLLVDQSGMLLFGTGDAFNPTLPQDSLSPNGKVLRLTLEGGVPADNPFPGSPVLTLGHRNIQGLVQLPNGELWSTEHGQDADDELNRLLAGRNYGWPDVAGPCDQPAEQAFCEAYDVMEPELSWSPTPAPSGLDFYSSPAIPQWRGALIAGFLKRRGDPGQRIKVMHLDDAGQRVLSSTDYLHEGPVVPTDLGVLNQVGVFGRIRDVLCAPDGSVYLCTSNREFNGRYVETEDDDRIIRIYNPSWNPVPCPDGCLSIYPNPLRSGQDLFLKFDEDTRGLGRVRVFDTGGRLVADAQVLAGPFVRLSLPALAAGMYIVEVLYPEGSEIRTRKFTVLP
jgi:aldose sugar dehydrogenase